MAEKAPAESPNVLIILYDDTGLAAWPPFGGRIEMPTMDRLPGNGLTSSQWHTTALCGPTRSCFRIGRDTGDSVSEQYTPFFPFEAGTIVEAEISVDDDAYIDLEQHLAAALARD